MAWRALKGCGQVSLMVWRNGVERRMLEEGVEHVVVGRVEGTVNMCQGWSGEGSRKYVAWHEVKTEF